MNSVNPLDKLAALIRSEREALLARWRQQVRALPSAQHLDVPILDVPPVAAQVHRDPVGATSSASTAAWTGSGCWTRRAWRTVATWSMLTPRRAIRGGV